MKLLATVSVSVLLLYPSIDAMASKLKITGMYSNMHLGTEDVTGVEIFLVYSRSGYYAVMQCAEGAPDTPIALPATVTGNSVEIEPLQDKANYSGCPKAKFRGIIDESGLKGSFEGTEWPGFLKRGKSYWQ